MTLRVPPDVPFSALRAFYLVAETGSFTKAAARLRVRQPAVSKLVHAVEFEFGEPLLVRSKRGATLTPAGAALVEACTRLFEEAEAIHRLQRHPPQARASELIVAASDHVATYLLPDVVERLRCTMPRLVLRILTGAAHLFLEGLADQRPELGLFFKLAPSQRLDRMVVARTPCQIVVRRDLEHDPRTLASFIGSREVDDLGNKAFPTLRMLQKHRPETRITLSCASLVAHKALVAQGLGVSILPLFVVAEELARREFAILHPEYVYLAELELVTKRGAAPSRAAKEFTRELRRSLRGAGFE